MAFKKMREVDNDLLTLSGDELREKYKKEDYIKPAPEKTEVQKQREAEEKKVREKRIENDKRLLEKSKFVSQNVKKPVVDSMKTIRESVDNMLEKSKSKRQEQQKYRTNSNILDLGMGPRRADSPLAVSDVYGKRNYVKIGDYADNKHNQDALSEITELGNKVTNYYASNNRDKTTENGFKIEFENIKAKYSDVYRKNKQFFDSVPATIDFNNFDESFRSFYNNRNYDRRAAENLGKQLNSLKETYPDVYELNKDRYDAIANTLTNTGFWDSKFSDNLRIFLDSISKAVNASDSGGGDFAVKSHVNTALTVAKQIEQNYPEQYKANKDWFDQQIKIAGDSDFRTGLNDSKKLINAVESKDKELASKTIEHMKKYAPKYFAENAAALYALYAETLSADEIIKYRDNYANNAAELKNILKKARELAEDTGESIFDDNDGYSDNTHTKGRAGASNSARIKRRNYLKEHGFKSLQELEDLVGVTDDVIYELDRAYERIVFKDKYGEEWANATIETANGTLDSSKVPNKDAIKAIAEEYLFRTAVKHSGYMSNELGAQNSPYYAMSENIKNGVYDSNPLVEKTSDGKYKLMGINEVVLTAEEIAQLGIMYSQSERKDFGKYFSNFVYPRENNELALDIQTTFSEWAKSDNPYVRLGGTAAGFVGGKALSIPAAIESVIASTEGAISGRTVNKNYGIASSAKRATDAGRGDVGTSLAADVVGLVQKDEQKAAEIGAKIFSFVDGAANTIANMSGGAVFNAAFIVADSAYGTLDEGIQEGRDPRKMLTKATITTSAEFVTEMIQFKALENMLTLNSLEKNVAKRIVKNVGGSFANELPGELISSYSEIAVDNALFGVDSNMSRRINKMLKDGEAENRSEATRKYLAEIGLDTVLSVAATSLFLAGGQLIADPTNKTEKGYAEHGEKLRNGLIDINLLIEQAKTSSNDVTSSIAMKAGNNAENLSDSELSLFYISAKNDFLNGKIDTQEFSNGKMFEAIGKKISEENKTETLINLAVASKDKYVSDAGEGAKAAYTANGNLSYIEIGELYEIVASDVYTKAKNLIKLTSKEDTTPDTIDTAAESAVDSVTDINSMAMSATDSAINDIVAANTDTSDTATAEIQADGKNTVSVTLRDGSKTAVNGTKYRKIQGHTILVVEGKDIGGDQSYYAVDSQTGKTVASGETKSVVHEKIQALKTQYEAVDENGNYVLNFDDAPTAMDIPVEASLIEDTTGAPESDGASYFAPAESDLGGDVREDAGGVVTTESEVTPEEGDAVEDTAEYADVHVKVKDGWIDTKGEIIGTVGENTIYLVDGKSLGVSNDMFAVNGKTGLPVARGDTREAVFARVSKNAKGHFGSEFVPKASNLSDKGVADRTLPSPAALSTDGTGATVADSVPAVERDGASYFTPAQSDLGTGESVSPVEASAESGDDGKKTTVTLISKDGLKTYEGVSVAEDTGYELTAVERNGGITIVENRSGMEFAHGATVEEAVANARNTIAKVGKDAIDIEVERAIERRKSGATVSAGSTSPISGDRLSVGRAVADANYTNTLLEMAKTSKNEKARKAAELYSSYNFKDASESYRALGDIAKILGVSEADLVKSRAKALYAKIIASISSETDVVDKTNAKIYEERQAAVSRGDTATVKALDYLTNLLNSEGGIISVSEMFAPNQYSTENPNIAVQVYGKRMETAFKNIGLDISVSVYYDSSENAARGEWTKHPNGHSEIKLNGAKLQGEQSAFWVVSHELIHEAESKSPGITQRMLDAFTKMGMYDGSQYEAYKARYSKKCEADFKKELDRGNVTEEDHDEFVRNYVNEEIVADLMSETMSSSELIEVFAGKLGKDDSNVIVSFLKRLINGIKKVFNSKDEFPNKFSDIIGMFEGAVKGTDTEGAKVNEATENVGVQFDSESKSAAPQNKFSYTTWSNSEYVQNRDVAASALAKAVGVSKADAERYINNINSIAKYIADNKERLDYEPNLDEAASVLKSNQDYKWTVDMSTLCAKRLITTGTFDAIQKALPNTVFGSEDIVHLRDMLMQRGYEVACGICYVESTRRELGPITADFIERYKESQQTGKPIQRINSEGKRADLKKTKDQMATTKDKSTEYFYADKDYTPTLADLNTTDIDRVKVEHPLVYEAYLNFMNARGQAKPKLLETRAEYKGEILNHFKQKNTVNSRNSAGGLRLQSFSDFEIAHLIDMMQITLDMSKVGLMSQAYTKVPAFAEVFGGTGIKINLSLIAKDSGLDANGNLIFDDVEGINHEEAFRLRDKYSENVGTILVGKNDAHIKAAMADPRIDFIIPFHKSSWKESLYDSLGLRGYEDYTDTQHEKPLDKSRKIHDFQPSEYWDYSKSGDENADIYLKKCREDGRIPKFPKFAGKPGYWKLLIDFKMYDNNGVGSPQTVVKPEFDMDSAMDIMEEYEGGHQKLPVAQDVVDDFVAEYKGETDGKTKFALSGKGLDSQSDSGYNNVINNGEVNGDERELLDRVRKSGELGREYNSDTSYRRSEMGEMGPAQSQRSNTPHAKSIHRSGVSAKGLTDSGLTAEHHKIRQQNKQEGFETEFFTEAVFNGENKQEVFNTDNTIYYPAYDFEQSSNDKDYTRYNTTALLKETTIDTYLKKYAAKSTPNYAQAYIAYMSPTDFLELTTSGAGSRIAIERESTKLQENRFGEVTRYQPIQLMIDHKTGKVESHEGRHRMVALMNAGIYDVPVLLFDSSNKYGKDVLSDFELVGQFNESHTATVGEAIPLNYINRDLVIEKFGTMSSRQKMGERYGTSKTLRYSLDDTGVYSLEDAWAEKVKKYGAIPKGEKAARDIKVPKKISDNLIVSQGLRTFLEAGATPDDLVSLVQEKVLKENFGTYVKIPDSEAKENAKNRIEFLGFEGAMLAWKDAVKNNTVNKNDMALAFMLYNQCAQNGDYTRAMEIMAEVRLEGTIAGQNVQAFRLLKQLTPDGTMYYLEKSVEKINKDLEQQVKDKYDTPKHQVEINQDLVKKFFEEKDQKKRDKIYKALVKDIALQIPSTVWDKQDSWRYAAMLTNPLTHVRNLSGNTVNRGVLELDNIAGTILERIFIKKENRTRAILPASKKVRDFVRKDWKKSQNKALELGGGKYGFLMDDIQNARHIFMAKSYDKGFVKWLKNIVGAPFEGAAKANSWALNAEDKIFLGSAYKRALAEVITARKLDVDTITEEQLSEIRGIAMQTALYATFRENNWLADAISKTRYKLIKGLYSSNPKSKFAQRALALGIGARIPFTNTPMNIVKQIVQHSPVGLATASLDLLRNGKRKVFGQKAFVSGNDIITEVSRGLTGTGLMILGLLLARNGHLSGGEDEEYKKEQFDKMVGEQPYSLDFDGESYTIDWMTPASAVLLVGAELNKAIEDGTLTFNEAFNSLINITEPVFGLSMLDGLRDILTENEYSENSSNKAAAANFVLKTVASYFTQWIPTFGGKVKQIRDEEKKNYYFVDKNSNVPDFLQELWGSVASKLPFDAGNFQPSVDLWGRVESYGELGERLAESLISPGYYSEDNYTEVDEELLRLYKSTGNVDVFPNKMYSSIKIDGFEYHMNAEHYTEAAIMLGEKRFDMLSRLFNDEIVLEKQDVPYSKMSDSEKAKIVSDVYYQALDETKYAMFDKVRKNSAKYGEVPEIDTATKIRVGKENASITYNSDPTGKNAYDLELYSNADNFVYKSSQTTADLSQKEKDEAEKSILEYAKSFPFEGTRGGELAANFYDKMRKNKKSDIKFADVFQQHSPDYDLKVTVDGKEYKANLDTEDYIDYHSNVAAAQELLRLACFGSEEEVNLYGSGILEEYKDEPWMNIITSAMENIPENDEDRLAVYNGTMDKVTNNIRLSYKYKYIPEYSTGSEYADDIAVRSSASKDAYTLDKSADNAYRREIYGKASDLISKSNKLIEELPETEKKKATVLVDSYAKGFKYNERTGGKLLAEAYDDVYGGVDNPELKADTVFDSYSEYSYITLDVDDEEYKEDFTVEDYIEYNNTFADADELARLMIFGDSGVNNEISAIRNKYKNAPWVMVLDAAKANVPKGKKEKLEYYTKVRSDVLSIIKEPYKYEYVEAYSSGEDEIDEFFTRKSAFDKVSKYYKDDDGNISNADVRGRKNFYDIHYGYIDKSIGLIEDNPKLSKSVKAEQMEDLAKYAKGLTYAPTEGQKLIMKVYEDYGVNEETYNKKIKASISRTDDPTLDKLYYDSADSVTVAKTEKNVSYTITFSQPDYLDMVTSMGKGQEYAALYVFKDETAANKYKATLSESDQKWIDAGYSEYKKEIKKINNLVNLGIISEQSAPAYYYYALTGKIKSAVRASYRDSYFSTFKKEADTPNGYYVKYNP